MKNVYILTEKGNSYNDAGCDFVTERIRTSYKDDSKLTFDSGTIFNDPKHLMKCIDEHPDCYITISTEKNVVTICSAAVEKLYKRLEGANGKTSWKIAAEMVEEMKKI